MEFLEGLALPERSAQIQDWDTSGCVYRDYIGVIRTLKAIQQVPQLVMQILQLHYGVLVPTIKKYLHKIVLCLDGQSWIRAGAATQWRDVFVQQDWTPSMF